MGQDKAGLISPESQRRLLSNLNNKPIKWERVRRAFLDEIESIEGLTRQRSFDILREFSEDRGEGDKKLEDEYYQTLEPDLEEWWDDKDET